MHVGKLLRPPDCPPHPPPPPPLAPPGQIPQPQGLKICRRQQLTILSGNRMILSAPVLDLIGRMPLDTKKGPD